MMLQEFIACARCLFCGEVLMPVEGYGQYRTCLAHDWNNHQQGNWLYHDSKPNKITSAHFILNEMQISLHFGEDEIGRHTGIYSLHNDGFEEIHEFDGVLDISLEPEALANKLKMMMVFS